MKRTCPATSPAKRSVASRQNTKQRPMKITHKQIRLAAVLLPAMVLTFTSCSTEPKREGTAAGTSLTAVQPGVAGGVQVDTYKETATVKAVDKASRKVTLV